MPAPAISWQRSLLLFVAVLLLAVPQAAMLPLIDRDEPRFAEAAREMIQGGDFIVPHFNNVPRYDKPPLIYWCQTVAYALFGENAFAARLPSLVATAATAVVIYTWGVRLGSGTIGTAAALCYSFCLQTVQQGRVATADALLIFFITLTAFAGWLILHPKNSRRGRAICHVVLALGFAGGFLAKGPEAWLPLLALLWCGRGARLGVVCSFIASLVLVLLWAVPAYVETNGDYLWHAWKTGIADRATTSLQSHGGSYFVMLPFYLVLFWISALPWSPLILVRARSLFPGWKPDLADTYLLLNIVPIFIIFTLMATKLPHYTLPAFPMIALLFVRRWDAAGLALSLPTRLPWGFGLAFTLATLIAVPLALAHGYSPSPVRDLVQAAGPDLTPDTRFALVDFDEPTAVWEMRKVCKGYGQVIDKTQAADFLNQGAPRTRALILSSELCDELGLGNESLTHRTLYLASGFNAAKGKRVDLVLIVRTP